MGVVGPDPPPTGRDNFEGEGASHCKVQGHSAVPCAKTAEPIEMPFGLRTWVSQGNHVLARVHRC